MTSSASPTASTASGMTPEQAALAFLTPTPHKKGEPLSLPFPGERFAVATRAGKIAGVQFGTGPAVLLVHGWEGHSSDLSAFVEPLLQSGFRVVAIDLPAHGESAGTTTSIPESARILVEMQERIGDLHAAVGHSVGTAVLVEAMGMGLRVARVALLSAPAHYVDYAMTFAKRAGLNAQQAEQMIATLQRWGVDVRSVSMPETACRLHQPVLFAHSSDDRVIAIENALQSAGAWRGAQFLRVENLGHRRILQAPQVIEAVVEFVKAT